ncbi:MAG: hypothetical protein R3F18_09490 [Lysobacterales bacterium]
MKAQHTRVAHVVITCTENPSHSPILRARTRRHSSRHPAAVTKLHPPTYETTPAPATLAVPKATAFANHCQHAQTLPISANALRTQPVAIDGKTLGLALSGGGFRATLFGLGSLKRLNDGSLLGKLDLITSVSGGSILAGILAQRWKELDFIDWPRASNFDDIVGTQVLKFCNRTIDIGVGLKGLIDPFRSAGKYLTDCYDRYQFAGLSLKQIPAASAGATTFIFYAATCKPAETSASARITSPTGCSAAPARPTCPWHSPSPPPAPSRRCSHPSSSRPTPATGAAASPAPSATPCAADWS